MQTSIIILPFVISVLSSSQVRFLSLKICKRIVIQSGLSAKTVSGKVACASLCTRTANCASYTFSSTDGICLLYSGRASNIYACDVNVDYGQLPQTTTGGPCTGAVANLRLCNGSGKGLPDPSRGRVEILYNDVWGTVCDDGWFPGVSLSMNAKVVCKLFGYSYFDANPLAAFGQGPGPILLDNVACTGQEPDISVCQHNPWGTHDCHHDEDVGVTCW